MTEYALQLNDVTKRFGAVTALESVSLSVKPNEVVGIIGENGAGKSTLLKVLAGIYQPDSGEIVIGGKKQKVNGPRHAGKLGIGVVHQEQSLVPSITVTENLNLGFEGNVGRWGLYRWSKLRAETRSFLSRVSSTVDPDARTDSLSFAERQMVEIAKSLKAVAGAPGSPVIVLDEPTSVLERDDIAVLQKEVEALREIGSVIFVSHRLDEVLDFCDRVYVMRGGQVVAERETEGVAEEELYRLMVGRDASGLHYLEDKQLEPQDEVVLQVTDLTAPGVFENVDLTIRAGEVVAIAGTNASGREEVARAIFGLNGYTSGAVTIGGEPLKPGSPRIAIARGVGYVPAERKVEGIIAGMSVAQNLSIVFSHSVAVGPLQSPRKRGALSKAWIDRLHIRPSDPNVDIGALSGGNQQKVAFARWMVEPDVRVLILDHPTRGLDPGAQEDIYAHIREACEAGLAVLVLGDTLQECIGLAHKVLVMRDGKVTALFDAPPNHKPTPLDLIKEMV